MSLVPLKLSGNTPTAAAGRSDARVQLVETQESAAHGSKPLALRGYSAELQVEARAVHQTEAAIHWPISWEPQNQWENGKNRVFLLYCLVMVLVPLAVKNPQRLTAER